MGSCFGVLAYHTTTYPVPGDRPYLHSIPLLYTLSTIPYTLYHALIPIRLGHAGATDAGVLVRAAPLLAAGGRRDGAAAGDPLLLRPGQAPEQHPEGGEALRGHLRGAALAWSTAGGGALPNHGARSLRPD